MFKFFKKTTDTITNEEDDDVIASITYLIKRNHKTALIDVELKDFDDESVIGLSKLLDILGDDNTFIDTINIIKASFVENERYDLLVNVFSKIHSKLKLKVANMSQLQDKPCVKPSEIWHNINYDNRG